MFVVDSSDEDRFEGNIWIILFFSSKTFYCIFVIVTLEAKLEFSNLLRCPDIPPGVPVLLIANKQDLPCSKMECDVETRLGIADLGTSHPLLTVPCCAVTGEGLDDVFDSLLELIKRSRKDEKFKRKASR